MRIEAKASTLLFLVLFIISFLMALLALILSLAVGCLRANREPFLENPNAYHIAKFGEALNRLFVVSTIGLTASFVGALVGTLIVLRKHLI